MRFLFILIAVLSSSCTLRHSIPVVLEIPEPHPFEEAYGESLWFTLVYFDGETITEKHIPRGQRRIEVSVKAGSLSVFALRPLGELGALGGFFEPGSRSRVSLLPEHGAFSEMLLRAASYRPQPVSRLSMVQVLGSVDDLQSVNEPSFLEDVFDGTLSYGIAINERIIFSLDSIPSGEWIPERFDIPSFSVAFSSRPVHFSLYPGVYRYAEADKDLLLTVIVGEDGSVSRFISAMPEW